MALLRIIFFGPFWVKGLIAVFFGFAAWSSFQNQPQYLAEMEALAAAPSAAAVNIADYEGPRGPRVEATLRSTLDTDHTMRLSFRDRLDKEKFARFAYLLADPAQPDKPLGAVVLTEAERDRFVAWLVARTIFSAGAREGMAFDIAGLLDKPSEKIRDGFRDAYEREGVTLPSDLIWIEPYMGMREAILAKKIEQIRESTSGRNLTITALVFGALGVMQLILSVRRKSNAASAGRAQNAEAPRWELPQQVHARAEAEAPAAQTSAPRGAKPFTVWRLLRWWVGLFLAAGAARLAWPSVVPASIMGAAFWVPIVGLILWRSTIRPIVTAKARMERRAPRHVASPAWENARLPQSAAPAPAAKKSSGLSALFARKPDFDASPIRSARRAKRDPFERIAEARRQAEGL
ncbi:hypothetical protein FGG78_16425 [Thioclava sp. BHET1]|nr:hypothetical protein FGG78_16425 [Thioclava sp. BHET1]